MEILKYLLFTLLGITALIILIFSIKTKKFFKTVIINSLSGILLITLIDITSKYTGVYIHINQYTVVGSAVFGIPALCGILISKFIFL